MSGAKRHLERIEQYNRVAMELLTQIGAITTCGMHDFYYNTYRYGDSELYARATHALQNKYPDMTDYKLFRQCVSKIMNNAADSAAACPGCQKLAEE